MALLAPERVALQPARLLYRHLQRQRQPHRRFILDCMFMCSTVKSRIQRLHRLQLQQVVSREDSDRRPPAVPEHLQFLLILQQFEAVAANRQKDPGPNPAPNV